MHNDETRGEDAAIPTTPGGKPKVAKRATATRARPASAAYCHGKGYATWIGRCDQLAVHTDDDGIVCLPSARGEPPAHDRLLKLLIAAWQTVQLGSWKPAVLDKLLADADCTGKGLDFWLCEEFFEQHAKCFHHRPFIWHVWDGLKGGFAALVNYHQLDHKKLERLVHTYLGDWMRQQEASVRDRIDGAHTPSRRAGPEAPSGAHSRRRPKP